MATMYEMIMDLPLFKGVSKDHVSQFLEKTNIGFRNYHGGEIIADIDQQVRMVRFVISGEVNIVHPVEDAGISVEERAAFGKVLGADRLFGIDTNYPYKAIAIDKSSIMEFSKEQYVNLLQTDRIYMLNFFNYLSLRAQRPIDSVMRYCRGDIMSRLCQLVCVMTDPVAKSVTINGSNEALGRYCSASILDIHSLKQRLTDEGIAECDANAIFIRSRERFLDAGLWHE